MFGNVLLQNNFLRSCWGNESVEKKEGGGAGDKLYYLVASAVGPNYSYAFLTVSPSLQTFFIRIIHSASRPPSHSLSHLTAPTKLLVTSMKLLQLSQP